MVSETERSGDRKPARYIRFPSRPTTVLCAPLLVSIVLTSVPSNALTTFQVSSSKEGTYRILPSGVRDLRSHPSGNDCSHRVCSLSKATQYSFFGVVK